MLTKVGVADFCIFQGWVDGLGDRRQPGAERRCGNDAGVVQNFWLGRKSLLVREILIDDT